MSMVVMHNVVSVDGYIADDKDDVGPLFDWYFNGEDRIVGDERVAPVDEGHGPSRVRRTSRGYVGPFWDSIGSMIMGRHLFDLTNGWGGSPPAGEHLAVAAQHPKPS